MQLTTISNGCEIALKEQNLNSELRQALIDCRNILKKRVEITDIEINENISRFQLQTKNLAEDNPAESELPCWINIKRQHCQ